MTKKKKVVLISIFFVFIVLFSAVMIYYYGATYPYYDSIRKEEFSIPGLDTTFVPQGFDFDEETLSTINKFFENNLNVSETSRQLYIHRNTLVYRLDKLQKSTNLDLRVFEDAITFKIALMVVKYMKYMETLDY